MIERLTPWKIHYPRLQIIKSQRKYAWWHLTLIVNTELQNGGRFIFVKELIKYDVWLGVERSLKGPTSSKESLLLLLLLLWLTSPCCRFLCWEQKEEAHQSRVSLDDDDDDDEMFMILNKIQYVFSRGASNVRGCLCAEIAGKFVDTSTPKCGRYELHICGGDAMKMKVDTETEALRVWLCSGIVGFGGICR